MPRYLSERTPKIKFGDVGFDAGGQGSSTDPAHLRVKDTTGTYQYFHVDTSGNLRYDGTTAPTSNTSGAVVAPGAGAMTYADVTISSAQLLALNATPISAIAAPGANQAIIVLGVVAYHAAGTAYAGIAAGEDVVLRYTNGSGSILAGVEATGFLDQATAQVRHAYPQSAVGTAIVEVTPVANAAVVAHMTSGEITTGDFALKLRIYYRVIPTVLS